MGGGGGVVGSVPLGAFHGGGPEKYGIHPSHCTAQQFLSFLHRLRAEYKQQPTDARRLYLLHLLRYFSLKTIANMDGRVVYQLLELLARLQPPGSSSGSGEVSSASDTLLVHESIVWLSLYGASPSTSSPKLVTQCLRQLLLLDCRDLLLPIFSGCKEVLLLVLEGVSSTSVSAGSHATPSSAAATRGGGLGNDAAVVWLAAMLHALAYHDGRTTSTPHQLLPILEQLLHQVVTSSSIEHVSSGDIRLLLEAFGMAALRAPAILSSPSSSTPIWKTCVEQIFMILAQERGEELSGSISLVESLHLVRSCLVLWPLLMHTATASSPSHAAAPSWSGEEGMEEGKKGGALADDDDASSPVKASVELFFSLVTRRALEWLQEEEEATGHGCMTEEKEERTTKRNRGSAVNAASLSSAGAASPSGSISSTAVVLMQEIALTLSSPEHAVLLGRCAAAAKGQEKKEQSFATGEKEEEGVDDKDSHMMERPGSNSSRRTMLARNLQILQQKADVHLHRYFRNGAASPDVAVTVLRMIWERKKHHQATAEDGTPHSTTTAPSPMSSSTTSGSTAATTTAAAQADAIDRSSPTHPLSLLLGCPSVTPPPTGCGRFYEDRWKHGVPSVSTTAEKAEASLTLEKDAGVVELGVPAYVLECIERTWKALLPLFASSHSERSQESSLEVDRNAHPTKGTHMEETECNGTGPSPRSNGSSAASTPSSGSLTLVDLQRYPFPWSAQSVHTLLCFWGSTCFGHAPRPGKETTANEAIAGEGAHSSGASPSSSLAYTDRVEPLRTYYARVLATVFRHAPARITPEDFRPFFMEGAEKAPYFPMVQTMVTTCMAHWSVHQVLRWLRCTAEEVRCTTAIRQLMRGAASSLTPFMEHASSEQLIALWYYFGRAGVRQEVFAEAVAKRFGKWCEEELEVLSKREGTSSSTPTMGGEGATVHEVDASTRGVTTAGTGRVEGGGLLSSPPPPQGAQLHLIGLSIVLSGFAGMEFRSRKPFLDAAPLLLQAVQSPAPISTSASTAAGTHAQSSSSASSVVSWYALAEAATSLLAAYAKMLIWHFQVVWGLAEYLYPLTNWMPLRQLLVVQLALQRMDIQHPGLTGAFTHRLWELAREGEPSQKMTTMNVEEDRKGLSHTTANTTCGNGLYGLSTTDITALLSVWSRTLATTPLVSPSTNLDHEVSREDSIGEEGSEAHTVKHESLSNTTRTTTAGLLDSEETASKETAILGAFMRAIAKRVDEFRAVEYAELLISLTRCQVARRGEGNACLLQAASGNTANDMEQDPRMETMAEQAADHHEQDLPATTLERHASGEESSLPSPPSTTEGRTPPPSPLFDLLTSKIINQIPTIPPVALAQVLHAYALLQRPHDELFSLAAQRVTRCKTDIAAVTIGSILASFAATGTEDTAFFMEMIPRVRFVAQFGTPRDVTNVVFAYATVKVWHFKLFSRLADRAIQLRMEFSPVHLVRLLQAYGMVEMRYDTLFTEFSPRIQAVAHLFSPYELSIVVESYARVHMHCPPVFEVCAQQAMEKAEKFTLADAERLLGALEVVGHVHPKVWLALFTQFPKQVRGKYLGVQQKMYVHASAMSRRSDTSTMRTASESSTPQDDSRDHDAHGSSGIESGDGRMDGGQDGEAPASTGENVEDMQAWEKDRTEYPEETQ